MYVCSGTIEALLSLGADVLSKDQAGHTPYEHCWFYKSDVGGGDFDASLAVLRLAEQGSWVGGAQGVGG